MEPDENAGMTPEQHQTRTAYYTAGYSVIALLRGWDVTPPDSIDLASLRQHLTWVIAGNLAALKGCRDSDPDFRRIDIPLFAAALSEKHDLPKAETVSLAVEVCKEVGALLNRDDVWALVTGQAYESLGRPIFTKEEMAEIWKRVVLERLKPSTTDG